MKLVRDAWAFRGWCRAGGQSWYAPVEVEQDLARAVFGRVGEWELEFGQALQFSVAVAYEAHADADAACGYRRIALQPLFPFFRRRVGLPASACEIVADGAREFCACQPAMRADAGIDREDADAGQQRTHRAGLKLRARGHPIAVPQGKPINGQAAISSRQAQFVEGANCQVFPGCVHVRSPSPAPLPARAHLSSIGP